MSLFGNLISKRTLCGYLSGTLLRGVGFCTTVIIGLLLVLALLGQMTPILQRHLGFTGIAKFAILRFPLLLTNALPLGVAIGTLVVLLRLTSGSEIAILRASGLSTWGFYKLFAPATLIVGFGAIIVHDQITPHSEHALASWWNQTDPHPENGNGFWFYDKKSLTHIGYLEKGGQTIHDIDGYQRNKDNLLTLAFHAKQGSYSSQSGWILKDVSGLRVGNTDQNTISQENISQLPLRLQRPPITKFDHIPSMPWPTHMRPYDFITLGTGSITPSTYAMVGMLDDKIPASRTPAFLETELISRFLLPVTFLVLLLIIMPIIYLPPRTGFTPLPVYCLGSSFVLIILQGLFRALGNAAILPPLLATLPILIIFALGALTVLIRNELQ